MVGLAVFFIFGLISFFIGISSESELYFRYNEFAIKKVEVEKIVSSNCGKGGSSSLTGYIYKRPDLRIGRLNTWDRCDRDGNHLILKQFAKN